MWVGVTPAPSGKAHVPSAYSFLFQLDLESWKTSPPIGYWFNQEKKKKTRKHRAFFQLNIKLAIYTRDEKIKRKHRKTHTKKKKELYKRTWFRRWGGHPASGAQRAWPGTPSISARQYRHPQTPPERMHRWWHRFWSASSHLSWPARHRWRNRQWWRWKGPRCGGRPWRHSRTLRKHHPRHQSCHRLSAPGPWWRWGRRRGAHRRASCGSPWDRAKRCHQWHPWRKHRRNHWESQ